MTAKANHPRSDDAGQPHWFCSASTAAASQRRHASARNTLASPSRPRASCSSKFSPATTPRSPRLPRAYRWAACMRLAERSCRSFAATSTTCCWPPPATAISRSRQRRRPAERAGMLPGRGHRGHLPSCRGIGRRSASAIWSSFKNVWRTAGTRASSSKLLATCSRCAGATTRGNAGLRAIGCGSACSIRDPNRA